jgi:putative flippase GtrA
MSSFRYKFIETNLLDSDKNTVIFYKWLIVGIITKSVDISIFTLLTYYSVNIWLSNLFATILALLVNFFGSLRFTWSHRKLPFISSFKKYFIINSMIFLLESELISSISHSHVSAVLVKLASMLFFTGVSLVINNYWVYKKSGHESLIQKIILDGIHCATVVRRHFEPEGINFVTDEASQFQIGYMKRGPESPSREHLHLPTQRNIIGTAEVLYIIRGGALVNLRSDAQGTRSNVKLRKGDVIYLIQGIHGIYFSKKTKVLEIKQGPYFRGEDKVFTGENPLEALEND